MTPTEQDKELLSKLDRLIIENQSYDGSIDISDQRPMRDEILELITADRKRVALEARIDPFEFVESCEPDCDDVRHAYHQGQWDMATRIKAQQEEE